MSRVGGGLSRRYYQPAAEPFHHSPVSSLSSCNTRSMRLVAAATSSLCCREQQWDILVERAGRRYRPARGGTKDSALQASTTLRFERVSRGLAIAAGIGQENVGRFYGLEHGGRLLHILRSVQPPHPMAGNEATVEEGTRSAFPWLESYQAASALL